MREPRFQSTAALLTVVDPKAIVFVRKTEDSTKYNVTGLSRRTDHELTNILKDTGPYSWEGLLSVLKSDGISTDSINAASTIVAILGIHLIKKVQHLLYAARSKIAANINGWKIYRIEEIRAIRIYTSKLKDIYKMGINNRGERWKLGEQHLGKNFYYSHNYDVTRSLQSNLCSGRGSDAEEEIKYHRDMYTWNSSIISALPVHMRSWATNVIYGYVVQEGMPGQLQVTIIARRSKYNAGTRLLRRGIDENGHVANEVETEQILSMIGPEAHSFILKKYPIYTSYIQVRGSIPIFWKNDTSTLSTKYPIKLTGMDTYCEYASKHFGNLIIRYGTPITVLNLIKVNEKQPHESVLSPHFERIINYLNGFLDEKHRIKYISFDMALISEKKELINNLIKIGKECLGSQKFFKYSPFSHHAEAIDPDQFCSLQNGIIRTNCIDCSDRTNAAQLIIGKVVFLEQLDSLDIFGKLKPEDIENALNRFEDLYNKHGNAIALQYGGSNLVKRIEDFKRVNNPIVQHGNLMEIIARGYSNTFTDYDKQKVINNFLGYNTQSGIMPTAQTLESRLCGHHTRSFKPPEIGDLPRLRKCSAFSESSSGTRFRQLSENRKLFNDVYDIDRMTIIKDSPVYKCIYEGAIYRNTMYRKCVKPPHPAPLNCELSISTVESSYYFKDCSPETLAQDLDNHDNDAKMTPTLGRHRLNTPNLTPYSSDRTSIHSYAKHRDSIFIMDAEFRGVHYPKYEAAEDSEDHNSKEKCDDIMSNTLRGVPLEVSDAQAIDSSRSAKSLSLLLLGTIVHSRNIGKS